MAESAPFVSLESQGDMWDDENSDADQGTSFQPVMINYRKPTLWTRTQIAGCVLVTILLIVIIILSVLLAQRKESKNNADNTRDSRQMICLKPECITASYGKCDILLVIVAIDDILCEWKPHWNKR